METDVHINPLTKASVSKCAKNCKINCKKQTVTRCAIETGCHDKKKRTAARAHWHYNEERYITDKVCTAAEYSG